MALQGPLGFLQFFGRVQAIILALPSSLLNPVTPKSSLFCTLPFPPFSKYYGNYARLHWLVSASGWMPLGGLSWLYFALAVILLQIVMVSPDIFRSIIWTLCPMWHISQIIFCLWGFLCVRNAGCRGKKITALGCNSWLHQPFRQPFPHCVQCSMCYQVIVSLCNRAMANPVWQAWQ